MTKPTESGMRSAVEHETGLNKKQIMGITGLNVFQCMITLLFGFNVKISIWFITAQGIAMLALFYCAIKAHTIDKKKIHFLSGVAGMLCGIGWSIGSFFIIPLNRKDLLFSVLGTFLIFAFGAFSGFIHDFLIAREKTPFLFKFAFGGIAAGIGGARIGRIIYSMSSDMTEIDWRYLGYACYLLFSFAGASHVMYFLRAHYAKILEDLERKCIPKQGKTKNVECLKKK